MQPNSDITQNVFFCVELGFSSFGELVTGVEDACTSQYTEKSFSLPHLTPELWGHFSPRVADGKSLQDLKSIVAGYVHRIAVMSGAHLHFLIVGDGEASLSYGPRLHVHFIVFSDKPLKSELYRAARRLTYGMFKVTQYKREMHGVGYMLDRHTRLNESSVICRKGRNCREKHIHREFLAGLQRVLPCE